MTHSTTEPRWMRLARQPIVHFLVLGALLFALFEVMNPTSDAASERTILVDRNSILNFMQYRTNAFEFDLFNRQLDELTPAQRRVLVEDYIREEVLYREALAMELEQGDYIIRQRMVQKLEFLIDDTLEGGLTPEPGELEAFYASWAGDYAEPPVYTFTHVFFDAQRHGDTGARRLAVETLEELNGRNVAFSEASGWGDRPLYFQNYVDRTRDFVVSHLGEDLTAELDAVSPSDAIWRGPYASPYGWHLVLLTRRVPPRQPDIEEIEERVLEDYRRMASDAARRRRIEQLVAEYDVDVRGLDLEAE
jgi:hypothetical protein